MKTVGDLTAAREILDHLEQFTAELSGLGLSTMKLRQLHAEKMQEAREAPLLSRDRSNQEARSIMELIVGVAPTMDDQDRIAHLRSQGQIGMAQNVQLTLDKRELDERIAGLPEGSALDTALAAKKELDSQLLPHLAAAKRQMDMRAKSASLHRQAYAFEDSIPSDKEKAPEMHAEAKRLALEAEQIPQGHMAALAHEKEIL